MLQKQITINNSNDVDIESDKIKKYYVIFRRVFLYSAKFVVPISVFLLFAFKLLINTKYDEIMSKILFFSLAILFPVIIPLILMGIIQFIGGFRKKSLFISETRILDRQPFKFLGGLFYLFSSIVGLFILYLIIRFWFF